jgi:NAD(P)-dependent dehydrogenase (short-subunit alcohol dehydrogenase family)
MGSVFSSNSYNVKDHGHSDRAMFDEYVADASKLSDLSGKVVGITGTSAGGMGFHIAEAAIRKKAKVLICLNRDSGSAKKGEEGLKKLAAQINSPTIVQHVMCDMQDLEGVKKAAEEVNVVAKLNGGLDVLMCNSGIMATRDKRTKEGFEVQMQTNQLSHFLLTSLVFPSLELAAKSRGEARFVTHSSSARDGFPGVLEEKYFLKCAEGTLGGDDAWIMSERMLGREGPWQRYHQTKLANSCFAMEMHNKLKAKGISNIKALTCDPGIASSNLQVASTTGDGLMSGWAAKLLVGLGQSAENGSLSAVMCAFSAEAKSGDMYMPEKVGYGMPIKSIEEGVPLKKGGEKLTCGQENQMNVWKWSEEGLGIKFEI